MDIFGGAIRHQQPIFLFKILPILRRTLHCLLHERCVVRMNPLENHFNGRRRSLLVLEDPKGFL